MPMPALFTRMSILPRVSSAAWTARRAVSSSRTSPQRRQRRPACFASLASASSRSARRATTTRSAPSPRKRPRDRQSDARAGARNQNGLPVKTAHRFRSPLILSGACRAKSVIYAIEQCTTGERCPVESREAADALCVSSNFSFVWDAWRTCPGVIAPYCHTTERD